MNNRTHKQITRLQKPSYLSQFGPKSETSYVNEIRAINGPANDAKHDLPTKIYQKFKFSWVAVSLLRRLMFIINIEILCDAFHFRINLGPFFPFLPLFCVSLLIFQFWEVELILLREISTLIREYPGWNRNTGISTWISRLLQQIF